MGRTVLKLGDDQYLEWSSGSDSPISYIETRKDLTKLIFQRDVKALEKNIEQQFEDANATEASPFDIHSFIMLNRAGDKETYLTLDQIKEQYKKPIDEG